MGKILEPKVEASGLLDVVALGLAKTTTERLSAPIIGNATVKSGAIKLVAGGVIGGKGGKIGKAVSGGLIVDGIEDMVSAILGNNGVGSGAEDGAW